MYILIVLLTYIKIKQKKYKMQYINGSSHSSTNSNENQVNDALCDVIGKEVVYV